MSKKCQSTYCLSQFVEANKYILYNGKKYDIDFDLIKRNSQYFKDHQHDFDFEECIEIQEPINLNEEAIKIFIDCCEFKKVTFSDSNIFDVNYLSIKYQVSGLQQFTEQYIEQNYDNLIFEAILFKQKIQNLSQNQIKDLTINIDSIKEEEILARHLDEYFNDERILLLPISIIDRVLKIYIKKNQYDNKKISSFLIFCLKNHKENASVLFLNLNFDKFDKELIINLYTEFSDRFDFNMLNSKSLFNTTYELISELEKIKIKIEHCIQEQKEELNKMNEYKQQINLFTKQLDNKQTQLEEKINDEIINTQNLSKNDNRKMEQKQNDFEKKQSNLETKQKDFEKKQSNLETKQNGFEKKQSNLETKQKDFEKKQSNLETKQKNLETKENSIEAKLRDFWPVGSIYQTFNDNFDPNVSWGGRWIKVEGKFILGSSSSHTINSVGGEETHKITIEEMPSHAHKYNYKSTSKSGNDTNTVMSYSENFCGNRLASTNSEGSNKPHNNMPPYRVAHIWERIK